MSAMIERDAQVDAEFEAGEAMWEAQWLTNPNPGSVTLGEPLEPMGVFTDDGLPF